MGKAKKKNEKNDSKYKRVGLSKKLEIIEKLERAETTQSKIAAEYGISKVTVHKIMKEKETIKVYAKSVPPSALKNITRKLDPVNTRMERLLMQWFEDCIQKRIPLSKGLITAQAVSLHATIQKSDGIKEEDIKPFKGSNGQFENFKFRSGIKCLQIKGEAASADEQAAKEFTSKTIPEITKGYTDDQIFNYDESGVVSERIDTRKIKK